VPLWDARLKLPLLLPEGTTVILRGSHVFIIPRQLGPRKRIEYLAAIAFILSSSCLPIDPVSLKPAEIMTACFTPFLPNSSSISATRLVGTTSIASSGTYGSSLIFWYALRPRTIFSLGCIGITSPEKPLFNRFRHWIVPIFERLLLAPVMAMDSGDIILCSGLFDICSSLIHKYRKIRTGTRAYICPVIFEYSSPAYSCTALVVLLIPLDVKSMFSGLKIVQLSTRWPAGAGMGFIPCFLNMPAARFI